jgi:MFS transporter, OPA family, glycerol-3-phosphate transporter
MSGHKRCLAAAIMQQAPKLIRDPIYEKWRWKTFAITWLVYAVYYFPRKSFAVAKVPLSTAAGIHLTREQFGLIDSGFLTAYAFGQFLFGGMGDLLGPKRILILGMSVCIAASIGSCFSSAMLGFMTFSILQGIGQSTGWSCTAKTMSEWFSLHERGKIMGWWCTNYAVGAALALPFLGESMDLFGGPVLSGGKTVVEPSWQAAFFAPAAVVLITVVIVAAYMRNRPEDAGLAPIEVYHGEAESVILEGDSPEEENEGTCKVIAEVLRQRTVWLLGFSYFAVKLTRYALYFWGAKYVNETLGTNAKFSAITVMTLPLGGAFGVLFAGYASDKFFQSRRIPMTVLPLIATVICMFIGQQIRIANLQMMALYFGLIGFFLFGPDSIISGTAAMDFGTRKGAGTATGLVNGVGSIGAILGGYLPGKITTETNWSPIFYVCIGGLMVSALMLAPMWKMMPPTAAKESAKV